jgi:hypothetical protein
MTDAELDAERAALVIQERELLEEHDRLHLRPDDIAGHRAHLQRLHAHRDRIRVFHDALQQRYSDK